MKRFLIVLAVLFAGIQLIRPEMTNPSQDPSVAIDSQIQMDDEIKGIFERACYDCHSYATKWPWYSYVAPSMWLVAHDVKEGRQHLNLSEWGNYSPGKRAKKLYQIAEVVDQGEMPLKIYIALHPEADLTDAERKKMNRWAEEMAEKIDEDGPADAVLKSLNPNP